MAPHDHAVSPVRPNSVRRGHEGLDHAVRLIRQVCQQSRSANLIAETRASLRVEGVSSAVRNHDSAALFDWLITMLSYRGISDQVAADYLERHGQATWQAIEHDLQRVPSCPKLKSYWHFHDCRYSKQHCSCAEPAHLPQCPLPKYWLRNGGLNQTAFSLCLFIRDVADGDLVRWLGRQLQAARKPAGPDRIAAMRMAVLAPLKEVYGVSDKVLMVALASLFLGAPPRRAWAEVGASMIAVDTLVHNFLHRTGILHRLNASHAYGPACYRPGGCAEIIELVAQRIDAREFHRTYPQTFPRLVQRAIWEYCAQDGRDICNGNRINDRARCSNTECQLYSICDRIALYSVSNK
jgi:hypothetical protein